MRVVRDDEVLMSELVPGTRYLLPDTNSDSHEMSWWDEIAEGRWQLRERTWDTHIRRGVYRPGDAHAVSGFWTEDGGFVTWYVDFIEPLRRTKHGFDFRDLVIDLVVAPDLSWRMKDEAEFERVVELGLISRQHADAVRREVDAVIADVERGPWWLQWVES